MNFQFTHPVWLLLLLPALAWVIGLFLKSDVQINAWRRRLTMTLSIPLGLRREAQRHAALPPTVRISFVRPKAPSPLRSAGALHDTFYRDRQLWLAVHSGPGFNSPSPQTL